MGLEDFANFVILVQDRAHDIGLLEAGQMGQTLQKTPESS